MFFLIAILILLFPSPLPSQETLHLNLKQAVKIAVSEGFDSKLAAEKAVQTNALKRKSLGALLPNLSVTGTVTRYDNEVKFGDRSVVNQWDYRATGEASLTIFNGQALFEYLGAKEYAKGMALDAKQAKEEIGLSAASAFFTLEANEILLKMLEEMTERRQYLLDAAKTRLEAGEAIELDVKQAELLMLSLKKEKLAASEALRASRDNLAFILSLPLDADFECAGGIEEALAPEESDYNLMERLDILETTAFLEAALKGKTAAWLSFLPKVSVSASFEQTKESFRSPDGFLWYMTLTMKWDLYDGGQRYGLLDEIGSKAREGEVALSKLKMSAQIEERAAEGTLKTAKESFSISGKEIELSEERLDLAMKRYMNGLGSFLEVTEAEEGLLEAKRSYIVSLLNYRLAELSLLKSRGILLKKILGESTWL